jgi:Fe-S-cluster containining protein
MRTEAERISEKTLKGIGEFADRIENCEPYSYRIKTVDGKCVFLRKNLCTIYDSRPLICRFYPFELKDDGKNKHVFAYTDECPCIGVGPELKRGYFEKLFSESIKAMRENAKKTRIL